MDSTVASSKHSYGRRAFRATSCGVSWHSAFCFYLVTVIVYFPSTGGCLPSTDDVISSAMSFDYTSSTSTSSSTKPSSSHQLPCFPKEQKSTICLNGGSCYAIELNDGIRTVYCSCIGKWTGADCSYIDHPLLYELGQGKIEVVQLAVVLAFIVASLLFLAVLVFVAVLYIRRRNRLAEGFRREKSEQKEDLQSVSASHPDIETQRENLKSTSFVCKAVWM